MSDNLPAQFAPQEIESFDGWDADDLLGWLREAAARQAVAERWTDAHRLNVGKALHHLRDALPEGQYGTAVRELAEGAGVTPRTLGNWRSAYESSAQLPPPKTAEKRADAQRQRRTDETFHKSTTAAKAPIETTAKQVPNVHLAGIELDDDRPPSTGMTTKPAPPPDPPDPPDPPAPPTAPAGNGSTPTTETAVAAPPSTAELVASLLTLSAEDLSGIDGPSLRSLVALGRGALALQAAKSSGGCKHLKANEKRHAWGTVCGDCGKRLR